MPAQTDPSEARPEAAKTAAPSEVGRNDRRARPWEERETAEAGLEAAAIGGRVSDRDVDPAQRPLAEAGEGVAEGFELAEDELIEAAQHGTSGANPLADAFTPEAESHPIGEYGEADHEDSSEVPESDR